MNLSRNLFCAALLCLSTVAVAHNHDEQKPGPRPASIDFIENKGQWNTEIRFRTDLPGGAMFLTDKGFVYNFVNQKDVDRIHDLTCGSKKDQSSDVSKEKVNYHAYKVNFVGASNAVKYTTSLKRKQYSNYFIGNDKSKWVGNVGEYGVVEQKNIYKGIDLKIYSSSSSSLKYDFVVAAGADPNQINLGFEGVTPMITKEGNLKIKTSVNEIIEKAPYTYQVIEGRPTQVKSSYKFEKGVLSFVFPEGYNKQYPLVIDPDLVFATYSGATGANYYAHSTTYDKDGNMYVGALGNATGWPTSVGSFQQNGLGTNNVSINKYDATGANLIFSTYYSGSGDYDVPNAMRVNDLNELVVVGATNSTNLPTTTGAFDATLNGTSDIFVAHFSEAGNTLIGATYVGGSGEEPRGIDLTYDASALANGSAKTSPCEIAFDAAGNIWVVSNSNSTDFPLAGAQQTTIGGAYDGVLFKLNPTCTNLMYSSYLGGSGNDVIYNAVFNEAGNLVVCGGTSSTNFPTTAGAYKTTAQGGSWDGFIAIINATSGAIMQSTYMGTNGDDNTTKLQVDCAGNIYALGRIRNAVYPTSPGVWSMPGADVYISKMSPNLSAQLLSTTVGGTGTYLPTAFLLDICGNVYIAGLGTSAIQGLPVTPDAFDQVAKPFWFCVLEPNFSDLHFGSYFGSPSGDHMHVGTSHFDEDGIIYHSVCASSNGFPTNAGSWSPNKQNTSLDIVSFKFNFEANPIRIKETSSGGGMDTTTHCIRGCKSAFVEVSRLAADPEPLTVKYLLSGTAQRGYDYQDIPDSIIIPANQLSATIEIKPLLIPNPTGVKEAIISVLSPCGCDGGGDQIVEQATVRIYDSLFVEIITPWDTVCPATPITIEAKIDTTLNFHWAPAAFDQGSLILNTIAYNTSRYSITVTQPGAPSTCPPRKMTYEIFVEPVPQITFDNKEVTVCLTAGDSLDINGYVLPVGTDYIYNWAPAAYLRDDHSMNNKFHAPVGDYYKTLTISTPVANCTSKDSILIHVVPPFSFTGVYPAGDTSVNYGDTLRLDTDGDAVLWVWSPITYLDDPLAKNPLARPLVSTLYEVVGIDQYGCRDTAKVMVNVKYESKADIPNAFSPNGDGVNDVFKVANRVFEKMTEFKVFNRYGQVVYDGKDPDKGWDGTIDGQPAAMDTYFYIIRLIFPGGQEKLFKGDLSLIR